MSHKILIAEDDENFRDILRAKLQNLEPGIEIIEARNGKEAFDEALKNPPNLIILDVNMPEMNGIEAFTKIKDTPILKNIKILFLTSYGDPHHEVKVDKNLAMEIGAADFFKKTDDLSVVAEKAKKILFD